MPKIITSNSSSSGASEFQQLNADWESNRGVTEILNKPKNATTTKDGFMSKEDKVKLNGVTESPTKLSQLTKDINFDERYYTETEMDAKLGAKVDNSRVLTDVPLNAKFTDTNTTYAEITTSEIDIGTASTLRTITGRRVQYIIDKVTTLISNAISNLTKSNVGLDMVDNVKQASKSEFDTHNTDTVKHITPTERSTWNTVTGKASTVHTHSKSQITDFPTSMIADGGNADTVSGFTVGINVPSNAKFTDTNTTYSEITTAEIDLGTATTSRVITARRVQYILDKVGGMISTAIGALTKSSVGLGNVDNTSDINKPISTATQTALDGKVNNSQVLTNVPIGAKFTDTNTITTINGKTGAIAKADIVALGIPASDTNTTYTVGAGLTLTGTVFTPTFGTTVGTVAQGNDSRFTNARTPLEHNHLKSDITDFPLLATVATSGSYNDLASKPTIPTNTTQLIKGDVYTKTEVNGLLSDGGLGDMLKSVYDTNGNGIVDNAEKVNGFTIGVNVPSNAKFTDTNTITTVNGKTGAIAKSDIVALGIPAQDTVYTHPTSHPSSMITGLPTSLPANGGQSDTSKGLIGDDTRAINSPPSEYMNGGSRYLGRAGWQTEFKNISTMGLGAYFSGTYCYVETKNPWSDPSGGYPIQIAYGNGTPVWRVGISLTTWSSWENMAGNIDGGTF